MRSKQLFLGTVAMASMAMVSTAWSAATAGRVMNYSYGSGAHTSYSNVNNALGETSRNTGGANPLYLSNPYNNPWRTTDWVSIGKGGHITLELTNFAIPLADAPEINVLVFQQILGVNPWYQRQARVSVSENGSDWVSLNAGNVLQFNTPATGYVFANNAIPKSGGSYGGINPATLSNYQESDYGLPMPGTINYGASTIANTLGDAYGLSGGGNWLDISSTGLSQVGYVRFDVDINAPSASGYFALDAVYLNNNAIGAAVPEPTGLASLALIGLVGLRRRRVR